MLSDSPATPVQSARPAADRFLAGLREGSLVAGGLLLVVLIGALDIQTGPQLSFAIFYLVPVVACAWWGGMPHGILLALAGSVAWHSVDVLENPRLPETIAYWNGITRFATLVMTSSLVARLRTGMLRERRLARTDPLTGAANARTFYEAAAVEAERAFRADRPLTVAYLDLDNFKQLNDRLGHAAGDAALLHVVRTARVHLRASDLLARLGGDEFALLLPETDGPGAVAILTRVQVALAEEMARRGWPVTLSVGAITYLRPAWDVDVMVQRVDALMYRAKRQGKARLMHAVERTAQGQGSGEAPHVERRACGRVLCNRPALARLEGEAEEEFVTVRDLSTGGVGLFLEKPFPAGTLLVIEPLTHGPRTLLAKVVRSESESGGWVHGCELPTRLSDEDLRCWLDQQLLKS